MKTSLVLCLVIFLGCLAMAPTLADAELATATVQAPGTAPAALFGPLVLTDVPFACQSGSKRQCLERCAGHVDCGAICNACF